jgi:hypothetical protein
MTLTVCYGCGARVAAVDGPLHRYIGASAGCWAVHGEVLARRYADPRFADPRLLVGNSYPVQHPGSPSSQSIQSVAVHLIGLYLALECGVSGGALYRALQAAADGSERYHWLAPPTQTYPTTIVDVRDATDPATAATAEARLGAETWAAWGVYQPLVRQWAAELGLAG